MDRHFFEFWKNAFTSAAQGLQQFETLSRWMEQGMKGAQEVSEQFRKAYGIDRFPESSEEARRRWDQAVREFKNSYQAFADGLGLVPREKYQALLKQCREQEALIARQKEELSRLRARLQMEKAGEDVKSFVNLMEDQAAQFQKAMEAMGTFLGQGKTKGKE